MLSLTRVVGFRNLIVSQSGYSRLLKDPRRWTQSDALECLFSSLPSVITVNTTTLWDWHDVSFRWHRQWSTTVVKYGKPIDALTGGDGENNHVSTSSSLMTSFKKIWRNDAEVRRSITETELAQGRGDSHLGMSCETNHRFVCFISTTWGRQLRGPRRDRWCDIWLWYPTAYNTSTIIPN